MPKISLMPRIRTKVMALSLWQQNLDNCRYMINTAPLWFTIGLIFIWHQNTSTRRMWVCNTIHWRQKYGDYHLGQEKEKDCDIIIAFLKIWEIFNSKHSEWLHKKMLAQKKTLDTGPNGTVSMTADLFNQVHYQNTKVCKFVSVSIQTEFISL